MVEGLSGPYQGEVRLDAFVLKSHKEIIINLYLTMNEYRKSCCAESRTKCRDRGTIVPIRRTKYRK